MSLGGGVALAAEPTPSATGSVVAPGKDLSRSASEAAANKARAELEARIKAESSYFGSVKEKWQIESNHQRSSFERQKSEAKTFAERERNRVAEINAKNLRAYVEANGAYEKKAKELSSKAQSLRVETETAYVKIDAQVKAYETEAAAKKKVAKTEDERRAITARYAYLIAEQTAKKTQIAQKNTEALVKLQNELRVLSATAEAGRKTYVNFGSVEAPKLLNAANAKLNDSLRTIELNRNSFEKKNYEEGLVFSKKSAELEAKWKVQRAELELKIKNGGFQTTLPIAPTTGTKAPVTAK